MTTRPPLPAPAQDLIGRRYSCRTYLDRPISADDQARLHDFMATRMTGPFGTRARFGLLAAAPGDRQALRRLGTYGFIKGATGFIVGAVPRGPYHLEDYGYLLEEIVLFATGIGIGTCWLGGTFTRSTFVRRFGGLGRDETMPAVIALGYAGDDGRGRIREREEGGRRLPAGELFFAGRYGEPLRASSAGRYAAALDAVRMAPSATNKQPWRIVRGGDGDAPGGDSAPRDGVGDASPDWHFLLKRTRGYGGAAFKLARIADLQRVDLGIATCHFALVARESGLDGRLIVDDPGLDLPAGVEYTATWRRRAYGSHDNVDRHRLQRSVDDEYHRRMTGGADTIDRDTLAWLLASDEPALRYRTLTEFLGEPVEGGPAEGGAAADGGDAARARREIMTQGAVPRILAAQSADGHFGRPGAFYKDKYRGTVWQLIVLAELGADPADARVRAACEAIFRDSQDPRSGGFSVDLSRRDGGGLPSGLIPCLTGNMVFSLARLGYLDDSRLQRAVDWIATWQRFDDGDGEPPSGGPYDRYEMCWGRHTCHMGVVKALKGLAEIPPGRRSAAVQRTIAEGTEYLLRHHVHKRSHDLAKVSKPSWRRFNFPLMWQTDALEILSVFAKLGQPLLDPHSAEALDLVRSRQGADGRWKLDNTQNGRFVVDIETKGQPSRWVTLRALTVVRAAERATAS